MQEDSEGRICPSRGVRAISGEIAEQSDEPCRDQVNLSDNIGMAGIRSRSTGEASDEMARQEARRDGFPEACSDKGYYVNYSNQNPTPQSIPLHPRSPSTLSPNFAPLTLLQTPPRFSPAHHGRLRNGLPYASHRVRPGDPSASTRSHARDSRVSSNSANPPVPSARTFSHARALPFWS